MLISYRHRINRCLSSLSLHPTRLPIGSLSSNYISLSPYACIYIFPPVEKKTTEPDNVDFMHVQPPYYRVR